MSTPHSASTSELPPPPCPAITNPPWACCAAATPGTTTTESTAARRTMRRMAGWRDRVGRRPRGEWGVREARGGERAKYPRAQGFDPCAATPSASRGWGEPVGTQPADDEVGQIAERQ